MSLLLALTGSAASVTAALAWVEDDDVFAIAATVGAVVEVTGGGWQRLSVQAYAERVALRKQLEEEIAEPIREAIAAQSTTRFESQEAEERAIKAAADAARIEYQALYLRLLAYQRQELLMEEEAIVMTMIAALSE
jgi:predicted nucleic acid-binding protein